MFNLNWQKKNKGFTLIELLVVISIISLLSTVVMASLQSARTKAQEAAIRQDLQSIKTQAELSYSKTGDYSAVATEIAPIITHINTNGGTAKFVSSNDYQILDGYKHYAVSVKFKSDSNKNWSVSDSGNVAKWDIKDTDEYGNEISYSSMDWIKANTACSIIGGRLPTIEESVAMITDAPSGLTIFAGASYWSSTPSANDSDNAWVYVTSDEPSVTEYEKVEDRSVRCVR